MSSLENISHSNSDISINIPSPQHDPVQTAPLGFGEHASPSKLSNVERAQLIHRIALVTLAIVTVASILTLSVFCPVIPLSLGILIAIAAGSTSLAALSAFASKIILLWNKDAYCGITNELMKEIDEPLAAGKNSKCDVIACPDTIQSFEWKKELIRGANHNIVLSGNYCGGQSFNEILDVIEEEMVKKPDLKVVIIASDLFIDESNRERIKHIATDYPQQFQLVETSESWTFNPSFKKISNHTKVLAIDYGTYFLIGGSGIEDKYAYTNGLGESTQSKAEEGSGWIHKLLPKDFRDMDFVFYNRGHHEGVGRRVYLETLKLAMRWDHHNKIHSEKFDDTKIAKQLILEHKKGVQLPEIKTHIEKFHEESHPALNNSTKVLFSGPEHSESPLKKELLRDFKAATERIVFEHLYFHPTEDELEALVDAANRGVKIKIITNGMTEESPGSHKFFVPRNRYNYSQLVKRVKPEARGNIEVFEFKVPKTTLHKKVIVVDNKVIAGNSNFGYKSLVTTSDHEINFVIKSKEVADKTVEIAMIDASEAHADKIARPAEISTGNIIAAAAHRALAPLIG